MGEPSRREPLTERANGHVTIAPGISLYHGAHVGAGGRPMSVSRLLFLHDPVDTKLGADPGLAMTAQAKECALLDTRANSH